jgi:hypothetical protein
MLPALISLERRGNGQLWKACVGIGWLLTWLSTLGVYSATHPKRSAQALALAMTCEVSPTACCAWAPAIPDFGRAASPFAVGSRAIRTRPDCGRMADNAPTDPHPKQRAFPVNSTAPCPSSGWRVIQE